MTRYHPTAAAKWAASTQPAEGGHLLWTGVLNRTRPVLDFRRERHQAARLAYQIHYGRDPLGVVRVTCGVALCVAPEHLADTRTRQNERALLRLLEGRGTQTGECTRGHDQAIHRRFRSDGRPYCNACNQTYRHKAAA
jgi:hypothetical protein